MLQIRGISFKKLKRFISTIEKIEVKGIQ